MRDGAHEPWLSAAENPPAATVTQTGTVGFAHQYALHAPQLGRYFRYYAHSPTEAEDLLAETSLTAWNLWPTYDPGEQSLAVWFFSIAQVVLRRRGAEPGPVRLERCPSQAPEAVVPASCRSQEASALSRPEREILALKYGGELSDAEIAQVTGLRRAHVHVVAQRALRKLGAQPLGGAQS